VTHSKVKHNISEEHIADADVQKLPSYLSYGKHRRTSVERRSDTCAFGDWKASLAQRVKMYTKPRLGVDRRKKVAERTLVVRPLLTPEEIEALIK
jgi:hypothetical protein